MYKASSELRALQLKCIEILDVVDKICRDNHIDYSLCGGSVVGAHLYKGFIPWDDDIDLMMTRSNYDRFLKVCKARLPAKYQIQNYRTSKTYKTLFTKIVDTSTTLVQYKTNGEAVVNGVFLDITVYDKVPSGIMRRIVYKLANIAQMLLYCDLQNPKTLTKKALSLIGNHCTPIYVLIEFVFKFLGNNDNYAYCELYGAFCQNKAYEPRIFESYTSIEFEGKTYSIVKNYVDYLSHRYERHDFYEPEEKQIPPHYAFVDLNLPYRSYMDESKKDISSVY